ncbi:hypothetical protein [Burkholderia gladioli]|jgi:hypothetical protein|uniref:hypothetical protein n=1 Tax=Burkholderia gladioli TaxID=28095 RepID=UPI00163F2237|nr:hypothetical protein [Burkholderia gladioli]MDN7465798.1 hypothetical protein [Burkholderia gladioli]
MKQRKRSKAYRSVSSFVGARPWSDLTQLSDAMFTPFVEAVTSRLPERGRDIELRARVAPNQRLATFGSAAQLEDTGLRVLGRPVWRTRASGTYLCEAVPGEDFLLLYQPNE